MIDHQASIEIERSAAEVFALADDFRRAPDWIEHCIELRQTSPGPRGAGATLHYTHRYGEMRGTIFAYERGRELAMRFADERFEVTIEFRVTGNGEGCRVTSRSAIAPRSLLGRMMAPMIGAGTRSGVAKNLERLKAMAESTS